MRKQHTVGQPWLSAVGELVGLPWRTPGIPWIRARPNGKPPFGKFVASPKLPRCRRFSSARLIDSATNQRPRCSSSPSSSSSTSSRLNLQRLSTSHSTLCVVSLHTPETLPILPRASSIVFSFIFFLSLSRLLYVLHLRMCSLPYYHFYLSSRLISVRLL